MLVEGKDKRFALSQSPFTGLYYMNSVNYWLCSRGRSAVVAYLKSAIFAP